ncbi:MAG: PD-(D/E)XK nuclease family protein [Woeseiaceae bacterium]
MYQWLQDALQGPSTVVTANRRLARVLREAFAAQQIEFERTAWESPAILAWQDWLVQTLEGAPTQTGLPTQLNSHQSRLLWERCLQREIGERASGTAGLVRLSRDARQRMADWQVSIREVARAAQTDDHRLFAAIAGRYLGLLERESWVDDAGLGELVSELLQTGHVSCEGKVTFVGFDRARPIVSTLRNQLEEHGCDVRTVPSREPAKKMDLQCFETAEAEMRAAGAWARKRLQAQPGQSIAIIAGNLEQQAQRLAHLVREGLVPGWQYSTTSSSHALNVSFGRTLNDFPAISIALLLLNWLVRDLSAIEVSHLMRTPLLASASLGGRSRLELRLRQLPERNWSPAMVSSAFKGVDSGSGVSDWLKMVAKFTKARRELKRRAAPAEWAVTIDTILGDCDWPGSDTLSSTDFQLVNRWRDCLNDLARLDLVSPSMDLGGAIRRLEMMAAETIFQPESNHDAVQLMGPLEASGAEFDAVWISGVTSARWPPPGNPSPLLSRQMQRRLGMPDAQPADTVAYAQGLLSHLGRAANDVVFSYAIHEDDAEQAPSALLDALGARPVVAQSDPGWNASQLAKLGHTIEVAETIPEMRKGEQLSGGAGLIQRQLTDPLSAFIAGRLGAGYLQPQAIGLPALLRGNIIHDALYNLYVDTPTQHDISSWTDEQLEARIDVAADAAFARHERNTDAVLRQLFLLERGRIARLMRRFHAFEITREKFSIAAVERSVEFSEAGVQLALRIDRIDRRDDGTLTVLDYKTGAKRVLMGSDGEPKETQLIAYALALDVAIAALALVNVDSREISIDGVGAGFRGADDWEATLDAWKDRVRSACRDLSAGDVRINALQGVKDARTFNLLSRYTELLRER